MQRDQRVGTLSVIPESTNYNIIITPCPIHDTENCYSKVLSLELRSFGSDVYFLEEKFDKTTEFVVVKSETSLFNLNRMILSEEQLLLMDLLCSIRGTYLDHNKKRYIAHIMHLRAHGHICKSYYGDYIDEYVDNLLESAQKSEAIRLFRMIEEHSWEPVDECSYFKELIEFALYEGVWEASSNLLDIWENEMQRDRNEILSFLLRSKHLSAVPLSVFRKLFTVTKIPFYDRTRIHGELSSAGRTDLVNFDLNNSKPFVQSPLRYS